MLKLANFTAFCGEWAYKFKQMLKTDIFLRKSIFFNIFLVILLSSGATRAIAQDYNTYGSSFDVGEDVKKSSKVFENMEVSDPLQSQLTGVITEVCQAKGCWMKVDLVDGKEVFVRFKDYGFFVPKDVAGKDVILNGMAFVEEMTVEDQKHYAEDEGATQEELAKITEPKQTLRFEADGVRIAN